MSTIARNDVDGILAYQLVEIRTILDETWGPAETWPETEEIDGWRWTLTEPQPLEPEPDEAEAPYEPSEADWRDYLEWRDRCEAMEPGYPAEYSCAHGEVSPSPPRS